MNPNPSVFNTAVYARLARVAARSCTSRATTANLRAGYSVLGASKLNTRRQFSTTRPACMEVFPAQKETKEIKKTEPAWPHPVASDHQLTGIHVDHRAPRTAADRAALAMVKVAKWGMNFCTGYKHHQPGQPYTLTDRKWFVRFIFLETIAGVPGMTAAMLRHFRSLRRMKRDNGWIETMLEDAYNERMHLLTFMKMCQPGWLMKFLVLGAQGVFANGFFLAYLVNPAICHRFVGYLEEEAVRTYTQAIGDLDAGHIPSWTTLEAPHMAIEYWNMPEGKRTMRDLLLYVRADEAKHREIHHTFGNLDYAHDPNPFVSQYKDESKPHPTTGLQNLRSKGWEREELM